MTAVDALARVQEIQTLVQRAHTVPVRDQSAFSAALSAAQAPQATTPAAAPTGAAAPATMVPTAPAASSHVGGGDTQFDSLIQQSAASNGVPAPLLKALISQESGFDPNAGSSAGARGLTQLMPGTAAALGVTDVTDPAQSIEGGARYLAQQLERFKDPSLALAAYNAGPGAVERYNGVPPYAETQNYVRSVLAKAQGYGG